MTDATTRMVRMTTVIPEDAEAWNSIMCPSLDTRHVLLENFSLEPMDGGAVHRMRSSPVDRSVLHLDIGTPVSVTLGDDTTAGLPSRYAQCSLQCGADHFLVRYPDDSVERVHKDRLKYRMCSSVEDIDEFGAMVGARNGYKVMAIGGVRYVVPADSPEDGEQHGITARAPRASPVEASPVEDDDEGVGQKRASRGEDEEEEDTRERRGKRAKDAEEDEAEKAEIEGEIKREIEEGAKASPMEAYLRRAVHVDVVAGFEIHSSATAPVVMLPSKPVVGDGHGDEYEMEVVEEEEDGVEDEVDSEDDLVHSLYPPGVVSFSNVPPPAP